jgi:hypothetical protein
MPDALEYVVRPYTAPDAHGRIIIPSTPTRREHTTLTWGATGTMPAAAPGIGFTVVCCKDALDEQQRQSDDVQIPIQDGADYVTVSRPNSLTLSKKESNTCGDNWDQISGVAQEVDSYFSDLTASFDQTLGSSSKNCGETWKFHNQ